MRLTRKHVRNTVKLALCNDWAGHYVEGVVQSVKRGVAAIQYKLIDPDSGRQLGEYVAYVDRDSRRVAKATGEGVQS